MSIDFEFHKEVVYFLPTIVASDVQCECCDKGGGHVVTIAWAFFSVHFGFGLTSHEEDSEQ